jgi:hypothetical protein
MEKHSRKEDWMAILTGTFLVAQGVFFLQSANLLTGGTTGLALLISQFTPFTFGVLYFLANCPFYLLAWKRFGRHFAINSAISGALVSIFADNLYLLISLESINEIYCAVAGGLLMGFGYVDPVPSPFKFGWLQRAVLVHSGQIRYFGREISDGDRRVYLVCVFLLRHTLGDRLIDSWRLRTEPCTCNES